MVYLLIAWFSISLLCLWAGWLFYQIFAPTPSSHERPLISYLFSGLMLLAALGQWLVLFLPLNGSALLITVLILSLLSLPHRKSLAVFAAALCRGSNDLFLPPGLSALRADASRQSRYRKFLFLVCFIMGLYMILVLNGGPVIMDDTESYHIQAIKWIQEYGTVPGIANLHLRFGFNSSWFTSIGLLSPAIKNINHYLVLNGLLSIGLFHYLLQKICSFALPAATSGPTMNLPLGLAALIIMALFVWPMLRGNAATANYDFITTCCLVVLFIEGIGNASSGTNTMLPESILWPCYLFTVRPINAPILLYALVLLIITGRSSKHRFFLFIVMMLFITIPFMIRNVFLSGYPLFPFYQLNPFHMDWKVNRSQIVEISEFIKYYNRSAAAPELVRNLPTPTWMGIWHDRQVPYDKILLDLSIACWIGVVLYWKKKVRPYPLHCKLLIITMLLQLCSWMCTAPDPRFVYGPLLNGLYAFAALFPITVAFPTGRKLVNGFLVITTGCLFIYTVHKTMTNPDYRNAFLPHALPVPTTTTIVVDGIHLQIPDKVLNNWNPRCYDLGLPCLYHVNPYLQARGKEIKDGFRLAPTKDTVNMQGEFKISDN